MIIDGILFIFGFIFVMSAPRTGLHGFLGSKLRVFVMLVSCSCFVYAQDTVPKIDQSLIINSPNIPDILVIDQHGNRHRFYSDLIKGKIVAINFIYTSCTTVCPILTEIFAQAHKAAQTNNMSVEFISISVDPINDKIENLQHYAAQFNALNWHFVTGDKYQLDQLTKSLDTYSRNKIDHSSFILIGNELDKRWIRINGLLDKQKFIEILDGISKNSDS